MGRRSEVGLYTISPRAILYGVWHAQRASEEGRILRNSSAIVWGDAGGRGNTRMIDLCTKA